MKHVKTLGIALAAVFMFSALAAADASAQVWLDNGAAIVTPVKVKSTGTLRLTDLKGGLFGGIVTIECKGTDTGTVGPGAKDTVDSITVSGCETKEGFCPSPTAKALHLGWSTELFLSGETVRDRILKGTGGAAPGYLVECSGVPDECTTETGTTLMKNLAGPVIEAEFDALSGTANCSRGGANSGHVRGVIKFEAAEAGHKISIDP